ncbi:MAG: efflux RND transporter periplasmic adaptor subunit [Bacteroidales bacterium]|nr:efflux RND transporter periplasmic adaptor subunit [Bacteroidales bacterium]
MSAKKNRSKYMLLGGFALIAILIIIGVNREEPGIEVTVEFPKRTTITEAIPANGKIQPVTEVKISPDVSGEIVELYVNEGCNVKEGDLLIKIKQDVYISAVDRAEASLNSIKAQYLQQKAQLVQMEQSHKRNSLLYSQKAISQAEYETSQAQYEMAVEQLNAAKYNVKSAQAALEEAKENLRKTTIYAPMTGIVSMLAVEKGERVVGTSQMAGTEMLRIANLNEMEVLVDVNENDIIRLGLQDTAYIEVDAYPNRKFKGTVTQIANSAKNTASAISDQVTNFEVRVSILSDSYTDLQEQNPIPFRPGMSASVSIHTQTSENALTVPLQAITTRPGLVDSLSGNDIGEQVFIYDRSTSQVKVTKVKSGIQDMQLIEITEGLTDSIEIVTGPYNAISRTLKDGSKVKVKEK